MIGHRPDAPYLKRLLEQVQELVCGVSFLSTDGTTDCDEVLRNSGIPYVHDITSYDDRSDFHFSDCRNRAMKNARSLDFFDETCWLMWLDCDDTIPSPNDVLKAFKSTQQCGYAFPYFVDEHVSNLRKVRIHRPNGWTWTGKVHEELRFVGKGPPTLSYFPNTTIVHKPGDEKSNHLFHVELLKKNSESAPNDYAYIGKELFNKGEFDDAVGWLMKAAAIHPRENEQYYCLMLCGYIHMQNGNTAQAEALLFQAASIRPQRREAWFLLAQINGRKGGSHIKKALAFAACCNAQIDEQEPMQNGKIYELDGYKLHAKLLNETGRPSQALHVLERAKRSDDELKSIRKEIREKKRALRVQSS